MSFLIVHLSDLHIGCNTHFDDDVVVKFKSIIANEIENCDDLLYLISGDIVNTGVGDEYKVAKSIFDNILNIEKLNKKILILTPGNHDVCLSDREKEREKIIDEIIEKGHADKDSLDFLDSFLSNYQKFTDSFKSEDVTYTNNNPFIKNHQLSIDKKNINVTSINSVLCAKRHCEEASLYFPLNIISRVHGVDINICVMHTTEN